MHFVFEKRNSWVNFFTLRCDYKAMYHLFRKARMEWVPPMSICDLMAIHMGASRTPYEQCGTTFVSH